MRAMTEMNQFLPAVLPMRPDGSGEYAFPDPQQHHWWRTATLENQPHLAPDPGQATVTRAGFTDLSTDDLGADVRTFQALVEAHGMQLLVLDQTRPDIGLPVAKVLVPGMRHFWARYAPGRLYDVPVQLGWLPRRLDETELNPIPMFL